MLLSVPPVHTRLADATALIYKTINSDQLHETQSLIRKIHRVLTVEESLVNKRGLVRI
jgi:hypothetical protein